MLVVIPVCRKDEALVLKNLDWLAELDGKIDAKAAIAFPEKFCYKPVLDKANAIFSEHKLFEYSEWGGDPRWPHPQNWAWQSVARMLSGQNEPWLWWEADSTPVSKGWFDAIRCEYEQANKPFMGCIMDDVEGWDIHMNGVGVYPPNVGEYSHIAMLTRSQPFDVVSWKDIRTHTHRANHIIQHHCRVNGDSTHFATQADVESIVRPGVVLFHRVKDGSLIDRLHESKPKGFLNRLAPKWVEPPKKKTVIPIIAHLDASSGYGIFAAQTAMELLKLGYEIELFPPSYNEIHGKLPADITSRIKKYSNPHPWGLIIFPCVIQPGNLVLDNKEYCYWGMWESSKLASKIEPKYTKAVERFNKCKVVVAPNSWNASTFNSCGVERPIRICPMGFDPDAFPLCANDAKGVLTFGTAAKTASGGIRKGFSLVVEAFRKAFPTEKDVVLKVKSFQEDPPVETYGDTRIEVMQKYITQAELVDWYRSLNVFASGSAAEGWGRHQHESMCMGRPVIGIDFGGVSEFFSWENGYSVDYTLVPAEGIYATMGVYAKPSIDSMAAQMRRAYGDRKELLEKSVLAAKSARRFTIEHSVQTLLKILKELKFPI